MFQTKVVEKIKIHFSCSVTLFRKSCRLWDNLEKYVRARQATDDNKILLMHCTCWISKATDMHSEYVIVVAFPRQQWLRERTSILRYMHTVILIQRVFNAVLSAAERLTSSVAMHRCCTELLRCRLDTVFTFRSTNTRAKWFCPLKCYKIL